MAKAMTLNRVGEMVPTAIGGTLGVFAGMVSDDAVNSMLSGRSGNVIMWTSFGIKIAVAGGLIAMSANESRMFKDAGMAAGAAILGTAIYGLLSGLAIING